MEQNEFYTMIAVILSQSMGERRTGRALDKLLLGALLQKLERDGLERLLRELKAALRAEIPAAD